MKESELTPLKRVDNDYFITNPRSFSPTPFINKNNVLKTFEFAWSMTFGAEGSHRDHRSGGTLRRKNGEIFANAFQGKLAEFAIVSELSGFEGVEQPDLSVYGLGKWDSFDVYLNSIHIGVKSTKRYGNLLLLETRDWSIEANYSNNEQSKSPDFLCMVRIDPDVDSLLRQQRLLYANTCEKAVLEKLITDQRFNYDCCGVLPKSVLKSAIQQKFILPRNAMLNGKTRMDAENFYVQAGDLIPLNLISEFE